MLHRVLASVLICTLLLVPLLALVTPVTALQLSEHIRPTNEHRVQTTPITQPPTPPFAPIIDVTSYGAVGDGETDDTAAILRANLVLLQSNTSGSSLLFPSAGTFLLNTPPTQPCPNSNVLAYICFTPPSISYPHTPIQFLALLGAGIGQTVIRWNASVPGVSLMYGNALENWSKDNVLDVNINDLTIQAFGGSVSSTPTVMFSFGYVWSTKIERVVYENVEESYAPLTFLQLSNVRSSTTRIDSCTFTDIYSFLTLIQNRKESSKGELPLVIVTNCIVAGLELPSPPSSTTPQFALSFADSTNVFLLNTSISNFATSGISTSSSSSSSSAADITSYISISTTSFTNVTNAVSVTDTSVVTVSESIFEDSTVVMNGEGVLQVSQTNFTWNNEEEESTATGIVLTSGQSDFSQCQFNGGEVAISYTISSSPSSSNSSLTLTSNTFSSQSSLSLSASGPGAGIDITGNTCQVQMQINPTSEAGEVVFQQNSPQCGSGVGKRVEKNVLRGAGTREEIKLV